MEGTAKIAISKGFVALVDAIDEDLAEFPWTAQVRLHDMYAIRNVPTVGGKRTTVRMHRVILSRMLRRELGQHEQVDHINGDGLDNRRSNLRLATNAENSRNRKSCRKSSSRYKGVSWDKCRGKWKAQIQVDGRKLHVGIFLDETDAAIAYDTAAIELHGDFAKLNFSKEVR